MLSVAVVRKLLPILPKKVWEFENSLVRSLPYLALRNSGDGQDTDPQSMDYPKGLLQWTTQMDHPKMDYL